MFSFKVECNFIFNKSYQVLTSYNLFLSRLYSKNRTSTLLWKTVKILLLCYWDFEEWILHRFFEDIQMADNFNATFRRLKRTEWFFYFAFIFTAFLALYLASYRQHMLFYLAFTVSVVYLVLMYKFSGFHNIVKEPYWMHLLTTFFNICIFVMSFEYYFAGCVMMTSSILLVVIIIMYKIVFDKGDFFHADIHRADNGFAYAIRPWSCMEAFCIGIALPF